MVATLPQTRRADGTWDWLRHFPFDRKTRWGKAVTAACAAFMEVYVTKTPPDRPLVAPRVHAESELQALLEEIPSWSDDMLVHMHKRFGTSRLFRVHHDASAPMTARATRLRDAALAEMDRRGLAPLRDEEEQDKQE